MPLAPRVARAVDLAVGERVEGPIFLGSNRERLDRHAAGAGSCAGSLAVPGSASGRASHTLRHAFITTALDAGVPSRDVQEAASHADPRTTMRYDRGRQSFDRHATYIVATFIAGSFALTTTTPAFGACTATNRTPERDSQHRDGVVFGKARHHVRLRFTTTGRVDVDAPDR